MHPSLVRTLLDEEVGAVRLNDVLVRRVVDLRREGHAILVTGELPGRAPFDLRFDGPRYDSEPLGLTVCDAASGAPLDGSAWPGTLYHSIHPLLGRPFCCIRGLREYHLHEGHLADAWEHSRHVLTFPTLLKQVLDKAGMP